MGLKDKLTGEVKTIFTSSWNVQTTDSAPDPEDLRLDANHAKHLESATVLYADLDGSTSMVDSYPWQFSAEVYESYLRCAGQIIRSKGGVITAYDGDRIMAIFTGKTKNTSAVLSALMINYAVVQIIRPALKLQYPEYSFNLKHVIGIDTSSLHVARIGVRGDNDLVWVGRAANYAAKMAAFSDKTIWITKAVYDCMNEEVKTSSEGHSMWERRYWKAMNNIEVYCSTYYWWKAT